jgi:hypothetical protein
MYTQSGGKTIASGSFGCVFSPALKCKNNNKHSMSDDYVTKLMTKEAGLKEYNEINTIKNKLKHIKNYKNYFLIYDLLLCNPDKLTTSDFTDFSKKCSVFSNENITKNNINDNLNKLSALTMPNGGIQIDNIIQITHEPDLLPFINKLSHSLIRLLRNGILPMNKHNIYHSDIKDSNVLVKNQYPLYPKLIDWGISVEYIPFKNNPFPTNWRNRPFIFNTPFSIILFTDAFVQKYTNFLKKTNNVINVDILHPFVLEYLYYWKQLRGPGHLNYINKMISSIFHDSPSNLKNVENDITFPCIIEYILQILLNYTKFRENGTLNLREYLDNIFIHNIDVWGFCVIYYPIYELFFINYNNLTKNEKKTFDKLKQLFIYLFTTPLKLDTLKIVKILSSFNKSIDVIYNNTIKKKSINNFNKTIKNKI